jgi:hypothetical protein
MKKKIYLLLFVMLFGLSTFAQESEFKKGNQVINVGIGFGSTLYTDSYSTTTIPPISISYEKGIKDGIIDKGVLSIGGYLGYSAYKENYLLLGYSWGWKYSDIIIGVRGNLHYPFVNKLDTYAGILLGYQIVTTSFYGMEPPDNLSSASGSGVRLDFHVGARYYFSDKISVMGELGYGIAILTLGVGIKL